MCTYVLQFQEKIYLMTIDWQHFWLFILIGEVKKKFNIFLIYVREKN